MVPTHPMAAIRMRVVRARLLVEQAPVRPSMVAVPRVPAALTKNQAEVPRAPMDLVAAMLVPVVARVPAPVALAARARVPVDLMVAVLLLVVARVPAPVALAVRARVPVDLM